MLVFVIGGTMNIINVVPVDEVEKHEKTEKCPCNPQMEKFGTIKVIVHNLINGKKYFEIIPSEKEWSKTPFTYIEFKK